MKVRGLLIPTLRYMLVSITLMSLLSSCLKQTMDAPTERKLTIAFTPQTLQMSDIDSAAVVFQKQNTLVPYYYRFQKFDHYLEVNLEDITSGNWTASLVVYTKKTNDNKSSQYNASLNFVAEQISGILILGPTSNSTSTVWNKSLVLSTPDNEIISVIPYDVTDPTFEVRVKNSNWDEVYIERSVYKRTGGMNELLGEATWSCTSSCFGSDRIIFNKQAFATFAQQNKARNWNNAEAVVILKDNDLNVEKELFFQWNKD